MSWHVLVTMQPLSHVREDAAAGEPCQGHEYHRLENLPTPISSRTPNVTCALPASTPNSTNTASPAWEEKGREGGFEKSGSAGGLFCKLCIDRWMPDQRRVFSLCICAPVLALCIRCPSRRLGIWTNFQFRHRPRHGFRCMAGVASQAKALPIEGLFG